MADFDATLVQEILDLAQRQREADVGHHRQAEVVKALFTLYAELGNLRLVEVEAECRGLRPKTLVSRSGRVGGGSSFARGQLHYLLTNPTYIGRICHKEVTYPGQHPAIMEAGLWGEVQAKLIAASARRRGRSDMATEARILTGKLRDETGDLLTPTHTQRYGKRFA